jgi:hypothetical protein
MLSRLAKICGTIALVGLIVAVLALPAAAFMARTWLGRLLIIVTGGGLYAVVGFGLLSFAFWGLTRIWKE